MKKKPKYSLTAKQRKEKQRGTSEIKQTDILAETDTSEAAKQKSIFGMTMKKFAFLVSTVLLALILILLAILLPLVINPYRKVKSAVAVISLSNGLDLEFELLEDDCPIAATNFIYLAKKKYFDGAIIFDMQNQFIRFGGYRDESDTHRANDEAFAEKITDITPPEGKKKFFYRLKADTSISAQYGTKEGYLSFMQADSATEFQICSSNGSSLSANNGDSNTRTLNAISFARYLDDETLNKIKTLYNTVYPETGEKYVHSVANVKYWNFPDTTIKIQKVKLYNLNKSKWKNFNFDDFLKDSLNYWTNS